MGKPSTIIRSVSSNSLASLKDLKIPKFGFGHHDEQDSAKNLEYEVTLMYGRYSANLAECARQEAQRLKDEEAQQEDLLFSKELQPYKGKISRTIIRLIRPIWDRTFSRVGEDWIFLFLLGAILATITFIIDYFVTLCFQARMYLHKELQSTHWTLELFVWIFVPTLLVTFSVAFCQWLAPSAAGSGIPEMKTILRGVVLKEYLTWKTLVTKIVSLTAVLGSGMPLGKEGPVMHMASIVSTMLMRLLDNIKGTVDNEGHTFDLLAAACTMGVAVCYGAPIGGVLFSIEVTAVYFAVRNYWRGFFAAIVGSTLYNLMAALFFGHRTIYPMFKVFYNFAFPYDIGELFLFICVGVICGFAGALFVFCHRRYVIFMRTSKRLKKTLLKSRFIYPTIVSVMISGITFPGGLGHFMASTSTTKQQALDLFSNITWTTLPGEEMSFEQKKILQHWVDLENPNFHFSLAIFQVVSFIHIAIASTLPVPNGILIPLFKVGAAFGRQFGELMVFFFPYGITPGTQIVPGAYAMVAAASFCGAISHTISISVIVFELTGQITYVLPIMIGVMISNGVASLLQPSIYDSVIRIKKLPYLPDISTSSSDAYKLFVEDFMVRDVVYIWYGMTYLDMKRILKENMKLKQFPLVDKHDSMILLGSIPRVELVQLLMDQISHDKRLKEAKKRDLAALRKRWQEEDDVDDNQCIVSYENENVSPDDTVTNGESRPRSGSLDNQKSKSQSDTKFKFLDLPKTSKLRNLFPPKSPFVRNDETRFSVSKVQKENGTVDGQTTESDSPPSDKSKAKLFIKANGKNATKQPLRLTRSNSLDSVRVTDTGKSKLKKNKKNSMSKDDLDAVTSEGSKTASTIDVAATSEHTDDDVESETSSTHEEPDANSTLSAMKGFLKRRNSLSLGFLGGILDPVASIGENGNENYQTITVVDSKLRHAIDKMKKIKIGNAASQLSLFKIKKKDGTKDKILDLSPEERSVWELEELSKEVTFNTAHIDAAPFQLVERTTLLKVHSIFSMLGVNYAYVTAIGRLVGVVALKEVRAAIEGQVKKTDTVRHAKGSPASITRNRPESTYSPEDLEAGNVFRRSISDPRLNGNAQ